jgi:ATP/ADP translocase
MAALSIVYGEKNTRPSNPAQARSLFSPITRLLLIVAALPYLAAYTSVSAIGNIIGRPNDSFFHLAALSSISVSAISSGSGRSLGGSVPFGSRTSSIGTASRNTFSTTTLLSRQAKLEAEDDHNGDDDDDDDDESSAVSTPKLSISDNATTKTSSSSNNNNSRIANDNPKDKKTMSQWKESIASSPRARACILMATAMSLHFGGYEFARSAALALFTSSETGYTHPSAYPFAIGLVTPTTLSLLYWYGTILKSSGPRQALRETTSLVLAVLLGGVGLVAILSSSAFVWPPSSVAWLTRAVVALLFVFQNSYAHLIYTQQWSFLGSVMTPTEGTRWFTFIAGWSSLVCTLTASSVQTIADRSHGLVLLMFMTCATLGLSMLCADKAYQLSSEHGFDPSRELQEKQSKKDIKKKIAKARDAETNNNEEESLLAKTGRMFRTSPTLVGLFGEVITFQSLSTVLNVCFVRQLKEAIPIDGDRAAFTGQFYAGVNGISSMMQFFVLPLLRKYLEPKWVYRFLPMFLMPLLTYAAIVPTSASNGLMIATLAFFALKSADYSIRGVATELVYQPLDFDARYLGKEVIGVFANRFGKSGTSMILSGLTGLGLMAKSTRPMSQLAVGVGCLWSACSIYLSGHVVTNRQAEEQVQQRSGGKRKPDNAVSKEAKPVSTTVSHGNEVKPAIGKNQTADGERKPTTERIKED